ncbi:hypothetical protein SAMD00019534_073680, partial [Acytostelium subglobosum LB1]|uniref:hypothetical protein n=1 Tax=Acytostelium subglobosum LB1 TaxID=1410327 RepID=UPI000644D974
MEFKAGMESVDINLINQMLDSYSHGTHYQEKVDRQELKTKQYITESLEKLAQVPLDSPEYQKEVDDFVDALGRSKDLSHTFIHIDMDAFYAMVEQVDDPSIAGKPVAVGDLNMLVTSNYIARKYGIRASMPGLFAMELCPTLIIKPSRMDRYRHFSSLIREVLGQFDPNFVSPSLDEACLDITSALQHNPSMKALDIAMLLRRKIHDNTGGLTCSMGIAPSPLLAKLSSEVNKPNGYFILERDEAKMEEFLSNTAIKKISGIGKTRQQLLETLGLNTVADILDNKYELYYVLSRAHAELLFKHALCIPIIPSPSTYHVSKKRTMISKEKTCKEIYDQMDLEDIMRSLYKDAVLLLLNENVVALGLIVMIKDFSFKVTNHVFSLSPQSKEPVIDSDGQVITSPVKRIRSPNGKQRLPPMTFQENCQKIWELFYNTVKPLPFDKIRCIGLRLVNFVEIRSSSDEGEE